LRDLNITNIDFLKLDVQGHEFEVVQGAQTTLHASPDVIILSEFWPDGIRQSCNRDGMEYLSFLADLNFTIYQVHGNKLRPIRGKADFISTVSRLKGRKYASLLCTKIRTWRNNSKLHQALKVTSAS
jgi:Methyltransferase FkbM domain